MGLLNVHRFNNHRCETVKVLLNCELRPLLGHRTYFFTNQTLDHYQP